MPERWPIALRFGGLGGQGLVTMGAVLAEAATAERQPAGAGELILAARKHWFEQAQQA